MKTGALAKLTGNLLGENNHNLADIVLDSILLAILLI